MSYLHTDVLDNGLSELADADALHYCSALPAAYADVATYSLGSKSSPTVGSPAARTPSGRKATVSSVSDGLASATGTIAYWALIDSATTRLLAASAVATTMDVTSGDTITSDAFDVGIPGPA